MTYPIEPIMEDLNLVEINNATMTDGLKRYVEEFLLDYALQNYLKDKNLLGSHQGVAIYFTDDVQLGRGNSYLLFINVFELL